MPTTEENYLLLWCIIEQKSEDGQLGSMDWGKIGSKMGIENVGSTKSRWQRLKADFQKMGFMNGDGPVDLEAFKVQTARAAKASKATTTPKAKKTANPKARSAVEKKGASKGKGKKGKATEDKNNGDIDDDDADNASMEVANDIKDEEMVEVEDEGEEDA